MHVTINKSITTIYRTPSFSVYCVDDVKVGVQDRAAVEGHRMEETAREKQRRFQAEVGRNQVRHQLRRLSRRCQLSLWRLIIR